mmetsp:Transcript_7925/g.29328  ORF Transcript_7925/g.29328 Transcript_7925/m.29328 type:complete len:224 (+) Transcript_7925:555-1226(+)
MTRSSAIHSRARTSVSKRIVGMRGAAPIEAGHDRAIETVIEMMIGVTGVIATTVVIVTTVATDAIVMTVAIAMIDEIDAIATVEVMMTTDGIGVIVTTRAMTAKMMTDVIGVIAMTGAMRSVTTTSVMMAIEKTIGMRRIRMVLLRKERTMRRKKRKMYRQMRRLQRMTPVQLTKRSLNHKPGRRGKRLSLNMLLGIALDLSSLCVGYLTSTFIIQLLDLFVG